MVDYDGPLSLVLIPDLQVIDGGVRVVDTAVIFCIRGNVKF